MDESWLLSMKKWSPQGWGLPLSVPPRHKETNLLNFGMAMACDNSSYARDHVQISIAVQIVQVLHVTWKKIERHIYDPHS